MKSEKFQAIFLHLHSHNYEATRLYISVDATKGIFDLFQTAHTEFRIKEKKTEEKWKKQRLNRMMKTKELAGIPLFKLDFFFQNYHSSLKIPSACVSNLCMYQQYAFYFFLHGLFIKNDQQAILFKKKSLRLENYLSCH